MGGISDIVIEGETALLADIHETEKFSALLLDLVEQDELRHRLGVNSHLHVLEKFSYHRLVKDMAQLYNELLEKKNK